MFYDVISAGSSIGEASVASSCLRLLISRWLDHIFLIFTIQNHLLRVFSNNQALDMLLCQSVLLSCSSRQTN